MNIDRCLIIIKETQWLFKVISKIILYIIRFKRKRQMLKHSLKSVLTNMTLKLWKLFVGYILLLFNICDSKYWFWCNGNSVNFAVMQSYVRILMSQPFFLWGHCIIHNILGYSVLIDKIWKMIFSSHCFSSYKWTYTKIPGKYIYFFMLGSLSFTFFPYFI